MHEWKLPWEGGCRCGGVRLRVTSAPLLASACHCRGCQTMSASAYSLTLSLPSEGFELISGEPVIGGLHGPAKHYFCPWCMSWMFTRAEGMDWLVNLRPTMLDEHDWVTPFVEVWTGEKLPWATTAAEHSFETQPTFEDYARLTAAFAAKGARPA